MSNVASPKRRGITWVVAALAVAVFAFIVVPSLRRVAARFFHSLRVQKPQTVNVDLSAFTGPNSNATLQQMMQEMISDKVKTIADEPDRHPADVSSASAAAGFQVRLLSGRKDTPRLTVTGKHAFQITVDGSRLQSILNEAGRPELKLPASVDGSQLSVEVPRTVRAQYGTCPGPPSATSDVATPAPPTPLYTDCVALTEGLAPIVDIPPGMDIEPLAEIGLEVAGMSPSQARQFLQTVSWKSTLRLSIPRFMRSYEPVDVDGVQGTLLNTAGRRGPTYVLIWTKDGVIYSLTGFGSSGEAMTLADNLK
jgi:hypothetical protein